MGGRPAFSARARGTVSSASANACIAYCSTLSSFSAAACQANKWKVTHTQSIPWIFHKERGRPAPTVQVTDGPHLHGQGAGDLGRAAAVDDIVVAHQVARDAQRVVQAALDLVQHLNAQIEHHFVKPHKLASRHFNR